MIEQILVGIVMQYGYLGVFVASAVSSASIFLPIPFFLLAVAAGALLNPILVAIIGGLGAALGELVGYGVGAGGKHLAKPEQKKWFRKTKRWLKGKKAFFIIIAFAATPLPDDVVGILAGFLRYDIKKFFVAMAIGKILLFLVLAYIGFYGFDVLSGYI